jgi:hypothetical protein
MDTFTGKFNPYARFPLLDDADELDDDSCSDAQYFLTNEEIQEELNSISDEEKQFDKFDDVSEKLFGKTNRAHIQNPSKR